MPPSDANHERFLRTFTEHEPAIRAFARLLLQRRQDVSGVMQEVTVTLWQKFDTFDPSQDFRKWAYGIVRFKLMSHLRDLSRSRYVFDDELAEARGETAMSLYKKLQSLRQALLECVRRAITQEGFA